MIEFFQYTRPMGYVNTIILVFIVILGIKNAYLLYMKKPHENLSKLGHSINTMLLWGAIIVVLGFIGSFQVAAQGSPGAEVVTDSQNVHVMKPGEHYKDIQTMDPPPDILILRDGTSVSVYIMKPGDKYKDIQNMDPPPEIIVPLPQDGKPSYRYVLKPGEHPKDIITTMDPMPGYFIRLDQLPSLDSPPMPLAILTFIMYRITSNMGGIGLFCTLILAFIIIIGLKNGYLLYIRKPHERLTKLGRSINTMLFWGGVIVVLGFLGTFIGLQSIIDLVMDAGADADVKVLLGGIFLLLNLVIFSLTSFTVISIVWYLFTARHRKLLELSMKEKNSTD